MLSLRLVRSVVLGETLNNPLHIPHHHHSHSHIDNDTDNHREIIPRRRNRRSQRNTTITETTKTPLLLFTPTKELVTDTYRLATIARDIGMDLHPTPSLSHIIFSYPCSSSSSSSLPLSSSLWSSLSLSSSSLSLPKDAVPFPFPSLTTAPLSHLRSFVSLSRGLFKLVFVKHKQNGNCENGNRISNWDCCTVALFSRFSGDRIDTMDAFSRALAGKGWTLFRTKDNPSPDLGQDRVNKSVYLFRKMDANRVHVHCASADGGGVGECRIRELRLPLLDFRNAPLRILQYILLMTDGVFYLA